MKDNISKLIDAKTAIWSKDYTYKAKMQVQVISNDAFENGCKEMAAELLPALKQAKEALQRVQPDATIPEHLDACKAAEEALETINKLIP